MFASGSSGGGDWGLWLAVLLGIGSIEFRDGAFNPPVQTFAPQPGQIPHGLDCEELKRVEWLNRKPTAPILSGYSGALRLPC